MHVSPKNQQPVDAEEDDEEDRRDRLAPGEDLQTSLDDINMLRTVRAANTISKFFRMRYGAHL